MINHKSKFIIVGVLLGIITPIIANAGAFTDGLFSLGDLFWNIGKAGSFLGAISGVISGGFAIGGILALLFLIIGGFRYVMSFGNPDQAESAKKTITYAIIGLILTISAYTLVKLIAQAIYKG